MVLDFENVSLKVVVDDIIKCVKEVDVKKRKENEMLVKEKRREMLVKVVLKVRGILMRMMDKLLEMEDVVVVLVLDLDDLWSMLMFLIVFFYFFDL